MKHLSIVIVSILTLCASCGSKSKDTNATIDEDKEAKHELQGVWINEEEGDVTFRMEGDSVYFPEESVAPMYFRVNGDTLIMTGANTTKYFVKTLTANLLIFINQTGESIRLVKNNDPSYLQAFEKDSLIELNQGRLIKRDTIVYYNSEKYHCYVQVNPTSYKVYKSSYNDDGMEVDNVYYDNILHISVFKDANRIYSSNVVKKEFYKQVEKEFLDQSVLSDMTFDSIDKEGIHYFVLLGIPNSSSNFMIEYVITYNGKVIRRIKNN